MTKRREGGCLSAVVLCAEMLEQINSKSCMRSARRVEEKKFSLLDGMKKRKGDEVNE